MRGKNAGDSPSSANPKLRPRIARAPAPAVCRDVPIEVYNAQIPVQLSAIDRVTLWINQIDPVWKWLVGAIGLLGGALAWVLNLQAKLRRQKQPAAASPPTT